MSRLNDFLSDSAKPSNGPEGIPWFASVHCQMCGEPVDEQTFFPTDGVLVWKCDAGHKSFMENFRVF